MLKAGFRLRPILICGVFWLVLFATFATVQPASSQSSVRPPESATSNAGPPEAVEGQVPGGALGTASDADLWRAVRQGVEGTVSIPDQKAGTLVQSYGESWRALRNGPFFDYLGMAMIGTLILLAVFFAIRGRIRIEHGRAGWTVPRFSTLERIGHWLMAVSFIILGLTGLNISYGRELILPIVGKDNFGPMTAFLKLTHNYVAFAFMIGLAIAFIVWVVHNVPNRHDLVWLAKGGGLFSRGTHPPAKKFNAGQKIVFWLVMIGGLSLSISGWALLFPFEYSFFEGTVEAFSKVGIDIPAIVGIPEPPYSVIQEQQFNSIWHAFVAVLMICLIFAHIYLGSIGMEGAYSAMGSGDVDANWAREHHPLWFDELEEKSRSKTATQPAE